MERALARPGVIASTAEYGATVQRTIEISVAEADALASALRDATAGRVQPTRP